MRKDEPWLQLRKVMVRDGVSFAKLLALLLMLQWQVKTARISGIGGSNGRSLASKFGIHELTGLHVQHDASYFESLPGDTFQSCAKMRLLLMDLQRGRNLPETGAVLTDVIMRRLAVADQCPETDRPRHHSDEHPLPSRRGATSGTWPFPPDLANHLPAQDIEVPDTLVQIARWDSSRAFMEASDLQSIATQIRPILNAVLQSPTELLFKLDMVTTALKCAPVSSDTELVIVELPLEALRTLLDDATRLGDLMEVSTRLRYRISAVDWCRIVHDREMVGKLAAVRDSLLERLLFNVNDIYDILVPDDLHALFVLLYRQCELVFSSADGEFVDTHAVDHQHFKLQPGLIIRVYRSYRETQSHEQTISRLLSIFGCWQRNSDSFDTLLDGDIRDQLLRFLEHDERRRGFTIP